MRITILLCSSFVFYSSTLASQTLQQTIITDAPRVEIFADGNVRNVLSQPGTAATASGSMGLRYIGRAYIATGVINVAGTSDTLTKGFGASLLAPATGRSLAAGLMDIRRRPILPSLDKHCQQPKTTQAGASNEPGRPIYCNIGLHSYASASSSRWANQIDSNGKVLAAVDVPTFGLGLGASYTFVAGKVGTNNVAMIFDVGIAVRALRGDLYPQDTERLRLLGDTKRNFFGFEFGLGLEYNEIKAGLSYYRMNGNVAGLSHGQVVAGISIQANLNSGNVQPEQPRSQ